MKMSEQIQELSKAMSKAQGEMKNAYKNAKGNFNTYSTIESVWDVARECLSPNGLSLLQDATSADKGINIETIVLHESGQWMVFGPLFIPAKAFTAHEFASALTYGKRYAMCAVLGIVSTDDKKCEKDNPEKDDDGQAANDTNKVTTKKQEIPIALITKDQLIEISEILKWTDKEIIESLLSRISAKYKINRISDLPSAYFPTVIKFLKSETSEKENDS